MFTIEQVSRLNDRMFQHPGVDMVHSTPNIDGDLCQFLKMTQLEYKNWISYGTIPNKTERHVIKNFGEYRNE